MKTSSRESESTLVILSEHPEAVADEIAGLTSIGSYLLLPQGSTMIHDIYFGVSDRELIKQGLALRVREIGTTRLITLKGPAQATDWGGIERFETEVPWSQDALSMIMEQLTDTEIEIPQQDSDLENAHPDATRVYLSMGPQSAVFASAAVTVDGVFKFVLWSIEEKRPLAEFALGAAQFPLDLAMDPDRRRAVILILEEEGIGFGSGGTIELARYRWQARPALWE